MNGSFYDSGRFEQVRVSHSLSLGAPVVSIYGQIDNFPEAFAGSIFGVRDADLERFFTEEFGKPAFYARAREHLAAFARFDPSDDYAAMAQFCAEWFAAFRGAVPPSPWRPTRLNLGSGKDYKLGWLNLDILEGSEPDLVLDLAKPVSLPLESRTRFGSELVLEAGQLEAVYANNVLEHVGDLPCLMTNLLALLREGGECEIEVPYEKALSAWQDPTHVRAMNENSWIYYTDWFWYLGWFEHRFELVKAEWLDAEVKPCGKPDAAFMRVRLRKMPTTLRERMVARMMRPDFGGIPEDDS